MQSLLKNYPITWTENLQWGDMDVFNHINSTHYFRYFENARIVYLQKLGLLQRFKIDSLAIVVRDQSCRYKAPLKYPDKISVGVSASLIKPDSLTLKYDIISHNSMSITTVGTSNMVIVDGGTGARSNMPDDVAEKIINLESSYL